MLKGYRKKGSRPESHLPITLPILHKLLDSACNLAIYRYQVCQFKAMCSTDFYAFLRVSEMTSTSSVGSPPPIQIGQLFKLADDSGNTIALTVARYSFSGSIPPKFERKLRRHKQRFGKINTTVVLDKDENLL